MIRFLVEYRCTDGRYLGSLEAAGWEEAFDRAAEVGAKILGPAGAEVAEDGTVTHFDDADHCPPCPKHLRGKP